MENVSSWTLTLHADSVAVTMVLLLLVRMLNQPDAPLVTKNERAPVQMETQLLTERE